MSVELLLENCILVEQLRKEAFENILFSRNRNLSDKGGYHDRLGVDITGLARQHIRKKGSFVWHDMCCGDFNAGKELISMATRPENSIDISRVDVKGIDVDPLDVDARNYQTGPLIISRGNVVNYPIYESDLITCVEGIYLINKYMGFTHVCKAITNWYNGLSVGGMLAATKDSCLYGRKVSIDISKLLKHCLGTGAVYEHERYLQITKLTPDKVNLPGSQYGNLI